MPARTESSARSRGWERKKANRDTYEEILETAAKEFSVNGYDGTSLADIASEVGIKTPALYYHFKSKNEILFAYLVRSGEMCVSAVERGVQLGAPGPGDSLKAFVKSYVKIQLENRDTMPMMNSVIFSSTMSKALTRSQVKWVRDQERKLLDMLREILTAGIEQNQFSIENVTATAFYILGSIDFVTNWYLPKGNLTIDQIADQFSELSLSAVESRSD